MQKKTDTQYSIRNDDPLVILTGPGNTGTRRGRSKAPNIWEIIAIIYGSRKEEGK